MIIYYFFALENARGIKDLNCTLPYCHAVKMGTRIHVDLDSVFVPKSDVDKLVFGLFKYASDKRPPPYMFTANIVTGDDSYLGVLKNNGVRLTDAVDPRADVVFDSSWKGAVKSLTMVQNMPVFAEESRACVYVDWDNVQVSLEYVRAFVAGVVKFIRDIKVHAAYEVYAFLHAKTPPAVKAELIAVGVRVALIIKDKAGCGDDEMFAFIRGNTRAGDSICVATGDRDFSPLMVGYVRAGHNVFLAYNKQAVHTFKHNAHWLGSVDVRDMEGVGSKGGREQKQQLYKTKPCKFYNLSACNSVSCNFVHMCGVCGRPHKMQDFHPGATVLKNAVCKRYNAGGCVYAAADCEHLHVCTKCRRPHPYAECEHIVMHCPLCRVSVLTIEEYIVHHTSDKHAVRMDRLKKIYSPKYARKVDSDVVLIT